MKTYGYDRLERPDAIIVTDSEGESEAEKYTYLYDENNQIVEEGKINNYAKDRKINGRVRV